jgi:hypothetical protein
MLTDPGAQGIREPVERNRRRFVREGEFLGPTTSGSERLSARQTQAVERRSSASEKAAATQGCCPPGD